ncbi:MAG TPA: Rpn family recombination-promoting nuclease/putative transposase [Thermoanaerobaculia bacterium]|nr:Rpn family recombination-promoting nuclease/putative transposase [Thermoanaerobaculia bacterium]
MANPHDKIFKQLLHAFLDDFLRLVVPEMFDRLDLSSPEFLDKELFAGGPHGRRRELDLLVRVRTLRGRPLLVHVEIEARAKPGMEERLWRYRNQILARYDTPVLTIVLNLKRGRPGVCLKSWENDLGPAFSEPQYVSVGLAGCQAAEYLARPEPLAWALAAVMDPGPLSRAELKMACQRRITGLRGRTDPFLLVDCVENYLQLDAREVAEFEALHSRRENQEVRTVAMTWSEKIAAQGKAEGEAKGVREILLLLLAERFGPLPEGARRQVEEISSLQRLTQLAKRVLTAHSLEEMGLA